VIAKVDVRRAQFTGLSEGSIEEVGRVDGGRALGEAEEGSMSSVARQDVS
jgi:hypothetical protein